MIDRSTLEEVRSIIGPSRALVYRNVELANWHDAIQPYLHEMARDQVHFGPIGAGIFAAAVSDAVDRLAALPPLRDESPTSRCRPPSRQAGQNSSTKATLRVSGTNPIPV